MKKFKLTFHGKRVNVDDLVADLGSTDGVSSVKVDQTSSASVGVLNRDPLNQFELVDVVIAFTVNLATAYTYEEIRSAIRKRSEAKGFTEKSPENPETKN